MKSNQWLPVVPRRFRCPLVALLLVNSVLALSNTPKAHGADGPKVIKPRVVVGVTQLWRSWQPTTKKFQDNTTSWVPRLSFAVTGPVPGGSQFVVDFTKPGDRP